MRHVPIEFWPPAPRRAMATAFAARAAVAAARIREQMSRVPCRCTQAVDLADEGRCSRCWGWPEVSR